MKLKTSVEGQEDMTEKSCCSHHCLSPKYEMTTSDLAQIRRILCF